MSHWFGFQQNCLRLSIFNTGNQFSFIARSYRSVKIHFNVKYLFVLLQYTCWYKSSYLCIVIFTMCRKMVHHRRIKYIKMYFCYLN